MPFVVLGIAAAVVAVLVKTLFDTVPIISEFPVILGSCGGLVAMIAYERAIARNYHQTVVNHRRYKLLVTALGFLIVGGVMRFIPLLSIFSVLALLVAAALGVALVFAWLRRPADRTSSQS